MESLIHRIRIGVLVNSSVSLREAREILHREILSNGDVSEEDFFLAWHAASILDDWGSE